MNSEDMQEGLRAPRRLTLTFIAFGVVQTRFGLPQSDHEVIQTGGRTIHVGMPAKQAQRLGVTIDHVKPPTEAEVSTPKLMPLTVLGRTGTITEAADAIFWLCSPLSDYVTGQVVPINGGARGGVS
jgi:3-oxoacyl-[acyl-carrier protein] reductase